MQRVRFTKDRGGWRKGQTANLPPGVADFYLKRTKCVEYISDEPETAMVDRREETAMKRGRGRPRKVVA